MPSKTRVETKEEPMSNRVTWAEKIEEQLGDSDSPPEGTRTEKTTVEKADGWSVKTAAGYGFSIDHRVIAGFGTPEPPAPGDPITVYAVGTKIVGIDLRGERLYLKSEREEELEWLLFRAQLRRQRLEDFERRRSELDAKYEALPAVLKARIDRFRNEDASFRVEGEAYEMAAVADAPLIARALANGDAIGPDGYPTDLDEDEAAARVEAFRDLPYEEQRKRVPDLNEGHSGNTFGAATMLAYRLLTGEKC